MTAKSLLAQTPLACSVCGWTTSFGRGEWRCCECGSPLEWFPDPHSPQPTIDCNSKGPARYAAALPVIEHWISLGDATTPITTIDIEGHAVAIKLDSLCPTGSFKDRGNAAVVSALHTLGPTRFVEDSSGNAASSLAGFAARAGVSCTVYAPATASPGKLVQARAYGAEVIPVAGSRADVGKAAESAHDAGKGQFYASHNWHPFFIAGVGVWLLETWEQCGGSLPTDLVIPVGSGSALLGAYRMAKWLHQRGEIETLPRLWAAQPAACAPVFSAWSNGDNEVEPVEPQPSMAEGTAIANPVRGRALLEAIRRTAGGAIATTESEIEGAFRLAASQGIYLEPTSAVAVAATQNLLNNVRP